MRFFTEFNSMSNEQRQAFDAYRAACKATAALVNVDRKTRELSVNNEIESFRNCAALKVPGFERF